MPQSIRISASLQSLHDRTLVNFHLGCPQNPVEVSFVQQKPCKSLLRARVRNDFRTSVANGVDGYALEGPASVELVSIASEGQFDRIIAEAQQLEEAVVVVWMATWCRKCIYLKPKLEKLAAEYYPRVRFHYVDVNTVPHRLVNRAGVIKMPTIQLWRDGKKQSEVIGGHKAWLVVNDVREMIEREP
ncbi:hypothetical protein H6P81_017680 [Aristolochia fimbriata]|uniref:Thioredoxin domain-containing protein n=1 Tax=Aristolochia fimbriata TaxID=158543 RepID=A0AAV7E1Y1_ARIFI|nr:hypothetical protein H6P81_017680 [Aristolochia fimbriata]